MPSQLIQMAFLFFDYAFRLFRSDLVNEAGGGRFLKLSFVIGGGTLFHRFYVIEVVFTGIGDEGLFLGSDADLVFKLLAELHLSSSSLPLATMGEVLLIVIISRQFSKLFFRNLNHTRLHFFDWFFYYKAF